MDSRGRRVPRSGEVRGWRFNMCFKAEGLDLWIAADEVRGWRFDLWFKAEGLEFAPNIT